MENALDGENDWLDAPQDYLSASPEIQQTDLRRKRGSGIDRRVII